MVQKRYVEIMVPLNYLSNFWRSLEMLLFNCKTNLSLTWFAIRVLSDTAANQAKTLPVTDAKLYIAVVTLSTPDNAKLPQHLN